MHKTDETDYLLWKLHQSKSWKKRGKKKYHNKYWYQDLDEKRKITRATTVVLVKIVVGNSIRLQNLDIQESAYWNPGGCRSGIKFSTKGDRTQMCKWTHSQKPNDFVLQQSKEANFKLVSIIKHPHYFIASVNFILTKSHGPISREKNPTNMLLE